MARLPLLALLAAALGSTASSQELETWTLSVDGVERTALVHLPEAARSGGPEPGEPAPLVLAFHGHGGRATGFARQFGLHREWPEAIVAYPQGLPTPSRLVDPQGKRSGWQNRAGDQGDRDLALFDALLERVESEAAVDADRIHVTGHSNGGGFTYLLLEERAAVLASVSPSASGKGRGSGGKASREVAVLHAGSPRDRLVRWTWQEAAIRGLRRARDCGEGEPWELDPRVTRFPAEKGADVLLFEHGGGHRHNRAHAGLAVRFFKGHPRKSDEPKDEPAPLKLELEDVQRVWDAAPHQASTDLVLHGSELVLAFREGDGHVGGADGVVRILTSTDGKSWTSRARVALEGIDLRDPELSATPEGDLLLLVGASRYEGKKLLGRTSKVARWAPGTDGELELVDARIDPAVEGPVGRLWPLAWRGSTGFGVVDQPEGERWRQHLVATKDGVDFREVAAWDEDGRPSGTALRTRPDGSLVALVRREGDALIGSAPPPFADWTWAELPLSLEAPELLVLDDGRMLASGCRVVGADGSTRKTVIGEVDLAGNWTELAALPSGGDTSDLGMALRGSELLVSYDASHGEKTAVHLARLRLKR